jgi:nucleoside-diphosphate-sugar epimerase
MAAEAPVTLGEVAKVNIGTGRATPIMDLARIVNGIAGQPRDYMEYDDPVPGEERFSLARVSTAQRVLGWQAAKGLEEGLEATYRSWFHPANVVRSN